MSRTTIVMAAALALAVTLPAVPAQAQSIRTFVSTAGSDSNPCSLVSPCRHFSAAVAATAVGGEVDALDPGAYGSFTISHAITIEGQGWSYVAPPANGAAITINAGASDDIEIRGVSLNGVGVANSTGILFNIGASLTIQDSIIRNVTDDGIHFVPTSSSSISVSRSFVGRNGGFGILVQPQGSASATAVFERVQTQYNGANFYGIAIDATATTGSINATATDSVSSNNGGGFIAEASASGTSLLLVRCTASNNHTGVQAGNSPLGGLFGYVLMSQVAIMGNVVGWQTSGFAALVFTFGDNIIALNSSGNTAPYSTAKQ